VCTVIGGRNQGDLANARRNPPWHTAYRVDRTAAASLHSTTVVASLSSSLTSRLDQTKRTFTFPEFVVFCFVVSIVYSGCGSDDGLSWQVQGSLARLDSEDDERRSAAVETLARIGSDAVSPLIELLSEEGRRQAGAIEALATMGAPAVPALRDSLESPDP